MNALPIPPSRVEQVYDTIIDDICTGQLPPGTPLRQEALAERFNVSRHPIQQALLLLKNQGLVRECGRRGLEVTPLNTDFVSNLYDLRAVLDSYAARAAAGHLSHDALERGHRLVQTGIQANAEHAFSRMITADVEFHRFLVEQAANPMLTESVSVIWRNVHRVMGEVLLRGGPAWVWEEHAAILSAVETGDADRAEQLARRHAEHGKHLILNGMSDYQADNQQLQQAQSSD